MMTNRLDELQRLVIKLEKNSGILDSKIKKISAYRLILFLVSLVSVLIAFFYLNTVLTISFFIVSIILQAALSYPHNKLLNSLQNHRTYTDIKRSYIARIQLDWSKIPANPNLNSDSDNPVAIDLNITGSQSLHHLIDLSSSEEGRTVLRSWLTNTAPEYNEIIKRQNLVRELVPLCYFRDKLLLNSKLVAKKDLSIKGLLAWLKLPETNQKLKPLLFFLSFLAPFNILLILLVIFGLLSAIWPFLSTVLYLSVYFFNQKYVKDTSENAAFVKDELSKFRRIFYFLENFKYRDKRNLKELCSPFLNKKIAPSVEIRKIKKIIFVLELQKNPFIWFILILIAPLDFIYSYKLNKIKETISYVLPEWLEVWTELEALISLAAFAYLNPEYIFPEIQNFNGSVIGGTILAKGLGHPLIPKRQKVCNDFSLNNKGEIAIITGSNMSGKSTFLRTFGINLMLAYSGAPVNAAIFSTSLLRVFTCIKVSDSVIDGISYFYAEVKRLKLLLLELEKPDQRPVLFLIDEIFKGTNNVERLIGSRSYIKALSGKNGSGFVSTHDLELVRLEDEVPNLVNYHFREEVKEGVMLFDYVLRRGPCPTTNALRIMQLEGLPIEMNTK